MDAVAIDPIFPSMDPSSAVYPTVRLVGGSLYLAYRLPHGDDSAVVAFDDVTDWQYGDPNDEVLCEHRLWGRGLTFYNFHRPAGSVPGNARLRWIATFHDGTFEISAGSARVVADRCRNVGPAGALTTLLGPGSNRILDEDAA